MSLIPEEYAYVEDEIELLRPLIVSVSKIPNDFPVLCNCLKFARENVYTCCVKQVACYQFCKSGIQLTHNCQIDLEILMN